MKSLLFLSIATTHAIMSEPPARLYDQFNNNNHPSHTAAATTTPPSSQGELPPVHARRNLAKLAREGTVLEIGRSNRLPAAAGGSDSSSEDTNNPNHWGPPPEHDFDPDKTEYSNLAEVDLSGGCDSAQHGCNSCLDVVS